MKPWEMDWNVETTSKEPWEMDWSTEPVDVSNIKASDFAPDGNIDNNIINKINSFFDNITTFKVEEAKGNEMTKALDKAVKYAKDEDFVKGSKEVGKMFTVGLLGLGKGLTGGALTMTGDLLYNDVDLSTLSPEEADKVKWGNFHANCYKKVGGYVNKLFDMGIESDWLKPDEEIWKGTFAENPSITRALGLGAQGLASVLFGGGVSKLTGSTAIASVALAGLDAQDIYFEAREAGESKGKSLALFTLGTTSTAVLEKAGLDSILKPKVGGLFKKVSTAMLSEGLTEVGQEVTQNVIKKIGYEPTQELFENVLEALVGGAIGGGGAAIGFATIDSVRAKAKEQGLTDSEFDGFVETVANELNAKSKTVDAVFQENINKTFKSFDEFIAKHEGTEIAKKASRTREELLGLKKDYFDKLKSVGYGDIEAESYADIATGHAYFMAETMGISPREYESKFPTLIQRTAFKDWGKSYLSEDIARLKKGVTTKSKDTRVSLLQAIKKVGGINTADMNIGDVKSILDKGYSSYVRSNGYTLDELSEYLYQEGYFAERPSVEELLKAIEQDYTGSGYYKAEELESVEEMERQRLSSLQRAIDESGASLDMPAEEIEKRLNDYRNTLEENRLKREISALPEDEQEKVWLMVDKGASMQEALNAISPVYDDIPFFQESMDMANENARLDDIYPAYDGETITINGVEKTVYNSNGERIAKSKEALENFYKWFGDSKVVDEQGRPLVVYHGTRSKRYGRELPEFDVFSRDKLRSLQNRVGFFFGETESFAKAFGDRVMPVYLKMNNPKIYKKGTPTSEELALEQGAVDKATGDDKYYAQKILNDSRKYTDAYDKFVMDIYHKSGKIPYQNRKDGNFNDAVYLGSEESFDIADTYTEKLQEDGFDGVIILNTEVDANSNQGKPNTQYVAFNPNQIKSTSNKGTYSESDNIYYQSAFAGSRVDYDRPSLEAIGSGEGAQAHGWGLYYALRREIAESYRKAFYDKTSQEVAEKVKELGKEGAIKYYKQEAQKAENRVKIFENEVPVLAQKAREDAKSYTQMAEMAKTEGKGQVHEVDIPENPYLLDEDLYFRHQSEFVQSKIKELVEKEGLTEKFEIYQSEENPKYNILENSSGKEIYEIISEALGSDKDASLLLNKYGIKGITYMGRQDGRCFVIFNPNDVKVIQKFYQNETTPQGAYANGVINLFERANRSTPIHEFSHKWKEELKQVASESPRVQEMLNAIDVWASSEFERKYKVVKRDNGYAVVNKRGDVIYDKRGNGFIDEQSAIDYAKEELFAQGFEKYCREGKAPNSYLKRAFNNFLMWLKDIYRAALSLDINLSPEVRNVYADLLGGADLDLFLNRDVDTFIEQKTKIADETKSRLDGIIHNAVLGKSTKVKKSGKGFSDIWTKSMIPLSTRAKRISGKLRNKLRRFEFENANELNKKYTQVKPFLDIWKTMSDEDSIAFDLALKNSYVELQEQIVKKYNAEIEWQKVRELLDTIYEQALDAGLEVNFRADYFPRKVMNNKDYLAYLSNDPNWSYLENKLREVDPENQFTEEERADFFNKYLRGFIKTDPMPSKYSSEKERTIDIVDEIMNEYYYPSLQSLIMYIEGMNTRIQASKFLGKSVENIDLSIGGYVSYLLDNNIITFNQVDEVKAVLRARFAERGVTNKFLAGARDVSYMYTMGGINSAITQLEDLSVSMYKAGVWNTLSTIAENKKITRKDLGIDKISAEFLEGSKTSEMLNKLFKLTGLDKIDAIGKETLVNAMMKKFRKMSDETLRQYLEPMLEDKTPGTITAIRNNEITDDVLFVLFNELSDVQPISMSELPEHYVAGGNLRILYMLKSFAVKRIDIFRNEVFDKIRNGNKQERIEGFQNLYKLAMLMVLCGVNKDMLINLLYGRDVELTETVTNNLFGLMGISKFHIYQAKEKGFSSVLKDLIFPPIFAPVDDLISDVKNISADKRDLYQAELLKGIPVFGRFYYWWVGRGKQKLERRKNKRY